MGDGVVVGGGEPGWLLSDPEMAIGILLFCVLNLLPHAWAVLVVRLAGSSPPASAVVAVGCSIFVAVDAAFLYSFARDEGSTAALIFVVLPVLLALPLGAMHLIRRHAVSKTATMLRGIREV